MCPCPCGHPSVTQEMPNEKSWQIFRLLMKAITFLRVAKVKGSSTPSMVSPHPRPDGSWPCREETPRVLRVSMPAGSWSLLPSPPARGLSSPSPARGGPTKSLRDTMSGAVPGTSSASSSLCGHTRDGESFASPAITAPTNYLKILRVIVPLSRIAEFMGLWEMGGRRFNSSVTW